MRHGYDVLAEREFGAAKSLMLKRDFEVVLMDLHLTGGNPREGIQMLRWIRERFSSTSLGVFIGSADGVRETARKLGVSVFLKKPATIRDVLSAVNTLSASAAESDSRTRTRGKV
jgi:DNA-binding response OmpR family regulator